MNEISRDLSLRRLLEGYHCDSPRRLHSCERSSGTQWKLQPLVFFYSFNFYILISNEVSTTPVLKSSVNCGHLQTRLKTVLYSYWIRAELDTDHLVGLYTMVKTPWLIRMAINFHLSFRIRLWTLVHVLIICYESYLRTLALLTHWGRVTHICVSNSTITGSDNGLSPGRHQAIIWTNAGILLIRTLGTNFSEILSEIHKLIEENVFENVCEISAILSRRQCVDMHTQ